MADNAIELHSVTKRFGTQTAVDQLDLAIPRGAIYGFIGPNGSGKTTTIRMILRIFFPDSGIVRVLGADRGDCTDDRVGYLPEERGLYRRMKVRDLLRYYARLKGFRDCDHAITEWLERLGAHGWDNKKIESLSKGMAQKVQFISAVVAKPELLILDEPFTGLDPVNLEMLRDAIREVRQQGTTVIFSTHEMDVAERLCDTVFMIHNGRKVLDGTIDSIQRQYPARQVKVRLSEGQTLPDGLPGVIQTESSGHFHYLTLDDPESLRPLLLQISSRSGIEHFELMRPSLHSIFVQIAGPAAAVTTPTGGPRQLF